MDTFLYACPLTQTQTVDSTYPVSVSRYDYA